MREMLLLVIAACLFHNALAQDSTCDYAQQISAGQTYYIYSPGYPNKYTPGVTCRWIATCATGYQCKLNCTDINLPKTTGCSGDRLLISKTGDEQLYGAETYCGQGTVTVVSEQQKISLGLVTYKGSAGGRFLCELTSQKTQDTSCSCGYKKTTRIVGGQQTAINEFPFMAGVVDLEINQIKCGATIIDNRHVMTAAHCFQSIKSYAVVVGEHDVTIGDSPATKAYAVSSTIIHPNFQSSNFDYDIALLKLAQEITFSGLVGPVCLPYKFANTDLTGKTVTLLGWGTKFPGGPTSNTLQKVNVQVLQQNTCQSMVKFLSNRQICNYTPGKDACQDDSGGPMVYTDPATGLLFSVGIISNGQFCASSPGVNTRVTAMLSWIDSATGVNHCRK